MHSMNNAAPAEKLLVPHAAGGGGEGRVDDPTHTDQGQRVTETHGYKHTKDFRLLYTNTPTSTMSNPEKERYRSATSNSIVFAFSRREPWSHTITPTGPESTPAGPPRPSPTAAALLVDRRGDAASKTLFC